MAKPSYVIYTKWLYLFIGVAIAINFSALFIPIIGPDGTLYASIAKTMVQRNNYAELFAYGQDWLDKPHFPFWVTALFFKWFGFTTWDYKLPAILFVCLGSRYTYLFAKELYNKQTALWAVLILLTAQHIVLSNNDVRAEPYLTGLIIAAVYHFYKARLHNNYWHLLWGCLFAACAVMTKGVFALVPIGGAIAGHFMITGQWQQLFNRRWLLAVVLILIFIIPELYCLYIQFDLHPEKLVFGMHHVSGIKFFFWDSQFGRFFNTGPIKGHGDMLFFVHTTLWAFLPWSLLLFAAIYQFIKNKTGRMQHAEWYCISGALFSFLMFSLSKFQLPHYLNIVFPFFAIITAQYLYNVKGRKSIRAIYVIQIIVTASMLLILGVLHYFYQPETFTIATGILISLLLIALFFLPKTISRNSIQRVFVSTLLVSFITNLYLNRVFYTSLLHYQAGSEAALWINHNNPEKLPVVQVNDGFVSAMNFYIDGPIISINEDGTGQALPKTFMLYAPESVMDDLSSKGWTIKPLKTFQRYWVSRLKPAFLNKTTREKEVTTTEVAIAIPRP